MSDQSNNMMGAATTRDGVAGVSCKSDYLVGYRKPPKTGQFKKGRSGNPKGRVKQPTSAPAAVDAVFAETIQIRDGDRVRTMTHQEVLQQALRRKALQGDTRAALTFFRRARKAGLLEEKKFEKFIELTPAGNDEEQRFLAAYHACRDLKESEGHELHRFHNRQVTGGENVFN